MKAHVNELLLYSRLPFHFFTEINGGRWPFDNPGCSVLSLCAAKLNQQVITVPDEVLDSVEQCRQFTTDTTSVMKVMQWIEEQSEQLLVKANDLPQSSTVFKEASNAVNHISALRSMLAVLFGGVTPIERLDVAQELTVMFLQAMIDVKGDIERLQAAVINAGTPSSPSKA